MKVCLSPLLSATFSRKLKVPGPWRHLENVPKTFVRKANLSLRYMGMNNHGTKITSIFAMVI